jgi:hypothetical protein
MEATMKDDLFDNELCGLVKFTDATTKAQKPAETKKIPASKEPAKQKKSAQKSACEPMDAEYQPVKTWYDEKTFNMVKWSVVFMGLEYLFFYWQQTGQMESSAAMPSMIVCALLAGISVGKNWKWKS